jgi:hypothetical protein
MVLVLLHQLKLARAIHTLQTLLGLHFGGY